MKHSKQASKEAQCSWRRRLEGTGAARVNEDWAWSEEIPLAVAGALSVPAPSPLPRAPPVPSRRYYTLLRVEYRLEGTPRVAGRDPRSAAALAFLLHSSPSPLIFPAPQKPRHAAPIEPKRRARFLPRGFFPVWATELAAPGRSPVGWLASCPRPRSRHPVAFPPVLQVEERGSRSRSRAPPPPPHCSARGVAGVAARKPSGRPWAPVTLKQELPPLWERHCAHGVPDTRTNSISCWSDSATAAAVGSCFADPRITSPPSATRARPARPRRNFSAPSKAGRTRPLWRSKSPWRATPSRPAYRRSTRSRLLPPRDSPLRGGAGRAAFTVAPRSALCRHAPRSRPPPPGKVAGRPGLALDPRRSPWQAIPPFRPNVRPGPAARESTGQARAKGHRLDWAGPPATGPAGGGRPPGLAQQSCVYRGIVRKTGTVLRKTAAASLTLRPVSNQGAVVQTSHPKSSPRPPVPDRQGDKARKRGRA